jgi:EAL domain-containing protein (putative c-di-GMP-specific phosphodiesterase class I)
MIDSSSLPYNMIHLEVTESILTSDIDDLGKKINKFRDFGFEVWLDDFGSGYSSLNTLQDFNFDVIKVDMRFLRSYGTNKNSEIIVSSIIDMAKKLGVKSLVEGVETEKQYNFLRDIGCDMAQGYLFSKPQPKEILFPTA